MKKVLITQLINNINNLEIEINNIKNNDYYISERLLNELDIKFNLLKRNVKEIKLRFHFI